MGIDPYGMESEILPHVGADAHIGPAGRTILTKNTAFFRMTRVVFPIPFVGVDDPVRPYDAKSQFHGFAGKPP